MQSPVIVDFPLRGEWIAPNTPGTKVPSHGTDLFGATYAYDFVGIDPDSARRRYFRAGMLRYLFRGVRLKDWFGWGRQIYAAAAGVVVRAEDGFPERNPVHPIRDFLIRLKNAWTFNAGRGRDFRVLSGNFIIVEGEEGYAVYAHAQTGSIAVSAGDRVVSGQRLASVGHSGNSTAPHLHFQLMDGADPRQAKGILCGFRDYERLDDGRWQHVREGLPKATDRIRRL